jgi:hypothetical protein
MARARQTVPCWSDGVCGSDRRESERARVRVDRAERTRSLGGFVEASHHRRGGRDLLRRRGEDGVDDGYLGGVHRGPPDEAQAGQGPGAAVQLAQVGEPGVDGADGRIEPGRDGVHDERQPQREQLGPVRSR